VLDRNVHDTIGLKETVSLSVSACETAEWLITL